MQRVLIIDTSILCVWLQVSGKTTCGSGAEQWNKERVDQALEQEIQAGTTLVLSLATIIETGNHISQAASQRYETAQALATIMAEAADEKTPWAAFTDQTILWYKDGLKQLAVEWVALASQKLSIGDGTIKTVAEYYVRSGLEGEIFTGDKDQKRINQAFRQARFPSVEVKEGVEGDRPKLAVLLLQQLKAAGAWRECAEQTDAKHLWKCCEC